MSMKKLLVGSVYGPGKRNSDLLKLQHRFFSHTDVRGSYDHACVFNNTQVPQRRYGVKVVAHNKALGGATNQCHADGLNQLKRHFLKNASLYQYFLFIDSDAWPIHINWFELLTEKMKSKKHTKDVATVIRYENLENRYHASILLCKANALGHLKFEVATKGDVSDVMGYPEEDVWIGSKYQSSPRSVYPLIRTNKENVHPVWSGVYGDMFYHHGGGTKQCQGRSYRYYRSFTGTPDPSRRFNDLMKNPCGYISKLAGWSPNHYVKFKDRI